MTRLPLVEGDAPDPITAEVFATSISEGRQPIALYRVLANNPVMLRSYAQLAKTLRYDAGTPRALRELMILRIAQLCGSEYEWQHHRKMAADAGVPDEKVDALGEAATSPVFDDAERAAVRLAEEQHVFGVTDETMAELRRAVGDAVRGGAVAARRVLRGGRADAAGVRGAGRARADPVPARALNRRTRPPGRSRLRRVWW